MSSLGIGGYVARIFYYPSIVLNAVANKVTGGSWYNRINEHVLLGAIPLPSMTSDLVNENVKGVISLNEDYELKYLYNTEEAWSSAGIKTLRLATPDLFAAPTHTDIKKAINFIDDIKSQNGRVLVHCKAGKTRSTTIVVCYLTYTEMWTPEQAYNFVKSKRPQVWLRKPQLHCIDDFYRQEVKGET